MGDSVTKFHIRKLTLKASATAVTFDTTANLDAETYSLAVKPKTGTFTPPRSEVTMVPLCGETAATIGAGVPLGGTFQNMIMDEAPWTNGKLTATLILRGDEDWETILAGGGTAIATNTYTRYSFGDSATGEKRVIDGAVCMDLDNGSEQWTAVMANPYMNMGEIRAVDNHYEVDVDMEALSQDCAMELKD